MQNYPHSKFTVCNDLVAVLWQLTYVAFYTPTAIITEYTRVQYQFLQITIIFVHYIGKSDMYSIWDYALVNLTLSNYCLRQKQIEH